MQKPVSSNLPAILYPEKGKSAGWPTGCVNGQPAVIGGGKNTLPRTLLAAAAACEGRPTGYTAGIDGVY